MGQLEQALKIARQIEPRISTFYYGEKPNELVAHYEPGSPLGVIAGVDLRNYAIIIPQNAELTDRQFELYGEWCLLRAKDYKEFHVKTKSGKIGKVLSNHEPKKGEWCKLQLPDGKTVSAVVDFILWRTH